MLRNNIGWFKSHHQNTWSLIFKYPKGFYRLDFFPASKMVIYNTELTYFPDLSFSENQFWDQIQPLTRISLLKLNYSFFSKNLVRCFPYKYLTSLVQKTTQETQKNEEKLHSKHHLCAGIGMTRGFQPVPVISPAQIKKGRLGRAMKSPP